MSYVLAASERPSEIPVTKRHLDYFAKFKRCEFLQSRKPLTTKLFFNEDMAKKHKQQKSITH